MDILLKSLVLNLGSKTTKRLVSKSVPKRPAKRPKKTTPQSVLMMEMYTMIDALLYKYKK